jgi:hypothetical protein
MRLAMLSSFLATPVEKPVLRDDFCFEGAATGSDPQRFVVLFCWGYMRVWARMPSRKKHNCLFIRSRP